jgi:hypothetical protein
LLKHIPQSNTTQPTHHQLIEPLLQASTDS